MKKSSGMGPYVSITDLVEHIIAESARVMEGTEHENNWCFYHDALMLMTAKETIFWIKAKGYYKQWIYPELGLYVDNPF